MRCVNLLFQHAAHGDLRALRVHTCGFKSHHDSQSAEPTHWPINSGCPPRHVLLRYCLLLLLLQASDAHTGFFTASRGVKYSVRGSGLWFGFKSTVLGNGPSLGIFPSSLTSDLFIYFLCWGERLVEIVISCERCSSADKITSAPAFTTD